MNDELLRRAKRRAAETDRTLNEVVEDALRLSLLASPTGSTAAQSLARMPTSGAGGLLPGVDLDDTSSLLDRLEDRA